MLLREAEAALGEEGGEALEKSQGGDGERDSERPRVGLLLGLCRGEKACSILPLRSWNICFCESKGRRGKAQRGRAAGGQAEMLCLLTWETRESPSLEALQTCLDAFLSDLL